MTHPAAAEIVEYIQHGRSHLSHRLPSVAEIEAILAKHYGWREGAPTEPGWYWLDYGYLEDAPVFVLDIDSDGLPVVQAGACRVHCEGIKRHLPIPIPKPEAP